MKKINLLPNIITALGLAFGLFVIFKITVTDIDREDLFHVMVVCSGFLMISGIADFLDGAVARLVKGESEFGRMFDSLSDSIAFGVAPSVMLLKSLPLEPGSELLFIVISGALIFSICGVLRLVRFSVSSDQSELELYHKNFTGLPIPAAAAAAVSSNLFLLSVEFQNLFIMSDELRAVVMAVVMVFLGYLMVSRWKFPSLKVLQLRVLSFHLVFIAVVSSVVILYGIMNHVALIFFAISWLYLLVACILSFIRLLAGKKSKTLKDFEPEPDEDL